MSSLFYKASYERRFPLSFLFFEDLGISMKELGELPEYEVMQETVKTCIQRALPDREIVDKDIEYVSDRLEDLSLEELEEKEAPAGGSDKQGFATSFSTWMAGLEPHDMCLVIAGFDYPRAKHLYCDTDREDVLSIASQWVHKEWEGIKVGYESVVYGFGGSYKDEKKDIDVETDDSTKGEVIPAAAIRSAGF